jgi:hypothetical protein
MIELDAITDQDRTDALAIATREDMRDRMARILDNVIYTAREIGIIQSIFRRTTIKVTGPRQLTVSAPMSPSTARRYGYLLSALIDGGTSQLQDTPVGIDYREGEIRTSDGGATNVYTW